MADPTRVCTTCKKVKPLLEYSPRKDRPLGVHYSCKICLADRARLWREHRTLSEEQKEKAKVKAALWRAQFPERNRKMKSDWRVKNLDIKNAANSRRRSLKMKSLPPWLTKVQKDGMKAFYWLAKDLRAVTGCEYHVDHIVPLQGEFVCGLHVPWNLQVLPADINLSKGNTFNHV